MTFPGRIIRPTCVAPGGAELGEVHFRGREIEQGEPWICLEETRKPILGTPPDSPERGAAGAHVLWSVSRFKVVRASHFGITNVPCGWTGFLATSHLVHIQHASAQAASLVLIDDPFASVDGPTGSQAERSPSRSHMRIPRGL